MLTALPPPSYPLTLSHSRPLRYGVFFYLYIMQGIPSGFYLTALTNYFTAEGIQPNIVGSFIAIIGLPWAFQFVWGPLIDRFQGSPIGRRKPWVVGLQLMTVLASGILLFVINPVAQITTLAWLFCLRNVFAAIQDASVNAMAIAVIPEDERGRGNAFMRAGFLVGTGIGAALFATILRAYGFQSAALLQVGFLLTGVLMMVFIREQPGDRLLPSFGHANLTQPESQPAADRYRSAVGPAPAYRPVRANRWPPKAVPHNFRWLFTELFRGLFARRSLLLLGAILLAYTSNRRECCGYARPDGHSRKGVEGSQFTTYMAFVNLGDIAGTYFTGNALLYLAAPTIGLTAGELAVGATVVALLTIRFLNTKAVG